MSEKSPETPWSIFQKGDATLGINDKFLVWGWAFQAQENMGRIITKGGRLASEK